MNKSFKIAAVIVAALVLATMPQAFAHVVKEQRGFISTEWGPDFKLEKNEKTGIGTITSYTQQKLHHEGFAGSDHWVDNIITEDGQKITIETVRGSIVYDKQFCNIAFYENSSVTGQTPILPSISYTIKGTEASANNYQSIPAINNSNCTSQVTASNSLIVLSSNKYVANTGNFSVNWIKESGKDWKVGVSVTNLKPTWTNHKVGFSESIKVPRFITLGNTVYDLSQYNNVVLDRQWILDHKVDLAKLSNKVNYSIGLGWDNFRQILITWDGSQAQLTFDYTMQNNILPVGQTLTIDPAFTISSGNDYTAITTSTTGATCGTPNSISSAIEGNTIPASTSSAACHRTEYEFNISQLATRKLESVLIKTDVTNATNARACDVNAVTFRPSTATAITVWNDANNGTNYLNDSDICTSLQTDTITDLGDNARIDLQTAINTGQTWFGLGFVTSDETRNAQTHTTTFGNGNLELIANFFLETTAGKPTGLTNEALPKAIKGTWTGCEYDGTNANTCTLITGIQKFNATRNIFAEMPLSNFGQSDESYPSITNSTTMANTKILYHFDGTINDVIQDYSGNNHNATSFGPTYQTGFSECGTNQCDGTWPSSDTSILSISTANDNLAITNNNAGFTFAISHDLGINLDATNWVMRFKFTPTTITAPSASNYITIVGMDSADYTSSQYDSSSKIGFCADLRTASNHFDYIGGAGITNPCTSFGSGMTTTTYYIETKRLTAGTFSVTVFSDSSFTTQVATSGSTALTGNPSSLRYVTVKSDVRSGANLQASVDDIQICNGSTIFASCHDSIIEIKSGRISNSLLIKSTNFTSTDNLCEGTNNCSLGAFVLRNSTADLNILSWNVSGNSKPSTIGLNFSKAYLRVNGNDVFTQSITAGLQKWLHVFFVKDANQCAIYINGTKIGSTQTCSTNLGTATNDAFYIGASSTLLGAAPTTDGRIDELYIKSTNDTAQVLKIASRGLQSLINLGSTGNATSVTIQTNCNECDKFYRIKLKNTQGNGTLSDLIYGTTDGTPDAPTLTLAPISSTQINATSIAGASNGGDVVDDYALRCEINGAGGWVNYVTNSTLPSNRKHAITGLASGDDLICQWRDGNDVSFSDWSNNATATTHEPTTGNIILTSYQIVGDTILLRPNIFVTTGSPSPITISQIRYYDNNTLDTTQAVNQNITTGQNYTFAGAYIKLPALDFISLLHVKATASNTTGTVTLSSASNLTASRTYNPSYFEADETPIQVAYNTTRDGEFGTISVIYETVIQNLDCYMWTTDPDTGTWYNSSGDVMFLVATHTAESDAQSIYGRCQTNPQLFEFTIFGNATAIDLVFGIFDTFLGDFAGLPILIAFIVIVLGGLFTGRTSDSGAIVLLAIVGVISLMGLIVMPSLIWGLLIFLAGVSVFLGAKFRD